jgi:hypothetical protein
MSQLVEGAVLDDPSLPDDADAVAERLELGQDVAGQEDRSAALPELADVLFEAGLHQRIEPRRGLVQQIQLHVAGERRDQSDLLSVPLRVGPRLLRDRARNAPEAPRGAPGGSSSVEANTSLAGLFIGVATGSFDGRRHRFWPLG